MQKAGEGIVEWPANPRVFCGASDVFSADLSPEFDLEESAATRILL